MSEPLAIVISLPTTRRRRRFVARGLKRVGLAYEFLDATAGADLDEAWIDENVTSELKARLLARQHAGSYVNTIACADSHRRAQRWVSNGDEGRYYLILEDDVLVDPALVKGWGEIIAALEAAGRAIALAGYSFPADAVAGDRISAAGQSRSLLEYPATKTLGAFGYLISPAGARKLLQCNGDIIRHTADNFRINELELANYAALISPRLVTSGYLPTSIGYPGSQKFAWLKRGILRIPAIRRRYAVRQQGKL